MAQFHFRFTFHVWHHIFTFIYFSFSLNLTNFLHHSVIISLYECMRSMEILRIVQFPIGSSFQIQNNRLENKALLINVMIWCHSCLLQVHFPYKCCNFICWHVKNLTSEWNEKLIRIAFLFHSTVPDVHVCLYTFFNRLVMRRKHQWPNHNHSLYWSVTEVIKKCKTK